MKNLIDIIVENHWDKQIDHCADILCKFVEGNKCLPKKIATLHLTEIMFCILQEFYEQILEHKE